MREINDRNVVRDLEKRRKTRVKRRKGKGGKRIGKRKLSSFWEAFAHPSSCN